MTKREFRIILTINITNVFLFTDYEIRLESLIVLYFIFCFIIPYFEVEYKETLMTINPLLTRFSLLIILLSACNSNQTKTSQTIEKPNSAVVTEADTTVDSLVYESENLRIRRIAEHTYEHTSYLKTEDFGKVSCNGMVVFNEKEAIVFDTPADELSSEELLTKLDEMGFQVKAVIATHFHADCVAGLAQFHARNIPSYANTLTLAILEEQASNTMPQNGFDHKLELNVGDQKVYAQFFGEGHTADNVVGYFPTDQALFGGCLIKEMNAGKGNLEDANTEAWSSTVEKIKQKYPEIQIVVPGHGKTGGVELLDYTIDQFQ